MPIHMTAQEARDGFSETMNKVAYGRERVMVQRHGKPLVAIVPIEDLEVLEAITAREDAEDIAAHHAAIEKGGAVPFADVVAELGL